MNALATGNCTEMRKTRLELSNLWCFLNALLKDIS